MGSNARVIVATCLAACAAMLACGSRFELGSSEPGGDAGIDATDDDYDDASVAPPCPTGHATCGAVACGVDLRSDARNCGACGIECKAGQTCVNRQCACTKTTCGDACVDLQTDDANCGFCGHACKVGSCFAGRCGEDLTPCPRPGYATCYAYCDTDTRTDDKHCGSCALACKPNETCANSQCTCTKTACGSACVDLEIDGANCGTCGHGCGGGACSSGKCQPQAIATKQNHPGNIVVSGSYVFWVNRGTPGEADGSIMRALADGTGQPETIVKAQPEPMALIVDGDTLIWSNDGNSAIMRASTTGDAVSPVASSQVKVEAFALTPTYVAWYSRTNAEAHWMLRSFTGAIHSAVLKGVDTTGYGYFAPGAPEFHAAEDSALPSFSFTEEEYLGTMRGDALVRQSYDTDGKLTGVRWYLAGLAVSYFDDSEGGGAVATSSRNKLDLLLDDGGAPLDLESEPIRVTGDSERIYWLESNGTIHSVPRHGGQVLLLVENQVRLHAIAAGSDALYWTADDSVYRVVKNP